MELDKSLQDNAKMKDFFILLSKGERTVKDWQSCQDAMGLTPLHYALILGNDKIFIDMVKSKFRFFSKSDYQKYERECPYDLCIWMDYLHKDYIDSLFIYISYEAKMLTSMIKAEKAHLFVQNRGIDVNKRMESIQRKRIRMAEKQRYRGLYAEKNKLDSILDNRHMLEQTKKDIEDTIAELEYELEQLLLKKRKEWKQQSEKLKKSDDLFEKRIREIIANPSLLLEYLSLEAQEWRCFTYQNISFYIPNSWNISQKSTGENKAKENIEDENTITKPYGNKWFSPRTKHDRKALKNEYRELAKKYHPDHNNSMCATAIFQDILAERMQILEAYK